jgi:hypothetical protein
LLSGAQPLVGQNIFQVHYNIFNPVMIDGTGYSGQSVGLNVLIRELGFEVDYGFTRKEREDSYNYLNPILKYQFSKNEEKRNSNKYHYLALGYNQFSANKNYTFLGRSKSLLPPYWDSTESAKTYHEYGVAAQTTSKMFEIGYQKVTVKRVSGVAFSRTAITDPIGRIVGWIISDGSEYDLEYTRKFKLSILRVQGIGWILSQ